MWWKNSFGLEDLTWTFMKKQGLTLKLDNLEDQSLKEFFRETRMKFVDIFLGLNIFNPWSFVYKFDFFF
jgi:hypothetical protein